MNKRKWMIYGSIIALLVLALVGVNLNISYSSKKSAERAKEVEIKIKLDKLARYERAKVADAKERQRAAIRKRIHESDIMINKEYTRLVKNLKSLETILVSINKLQDLNGTVKPEHEAALYQADLIVEKRKLNIENLRANKAEDQKLLDDLSY